MRGKRKSAERRSPNRRVGERPQVNAGSETGAPPLREEATPYRTVADSPPSPLGGERAGERGAPIPHSAFPAPRFIDLFCGIGGFRLAFERAGARCVFSSDWDKFSRQTYAANFGEAPHGNIYAVADADIPAHDILCAGFPCQPFSIAGVSKKLSLGRKHGFQDKKQGNLFFTLAEIIDYHRPAAFVLENVKHLVRHDQGRTFEIIRNTLTDVPDNLLGER